jgi:hypothetical protein
MTDRVSQNCVNCHFLQKWAYGKGGEEQKVIVEGMERQNVATHTFWARGGGGDLECYFGVWDGGSDFARQVGYKEVVQTDRRDFCFFWPYRPNMGVKAAEILQERAARQRYTGRLQFRIIVALYVVAGALALDIILRVIGLLLK